MRNRYGQRNSNSKESNDSNIIKYNFNNRFVISKEKSPKNIPKNNIANLSLNNNYETESQKEIYKNKIISKIKKYNPNLKIIRQSSYSRFDNEKSEFMNNITKNNKEIKQRIKMLSINYIKKKRERNSQQKNYSSSNIKDFDSPKNLKNGSYTIGSESTSITKKKKFQLKPYKSNKHFDINDNKINTEQNKENISDNYIIPFSAVANNDNKNKVRESFKYLIHQAYKNKALSKSFCRFYKSSRSKEKNNNNDDKNHSNNNKELNEKKYTKNNIIKMNLIKKDNSGIKKNNNFSELNNGSRNNNIRTINFKDKNIFLTTSFGNNNSFFGKSFNKKEKDNYVEDFEIIYKFLNKVKIIINKIDKFEQIEKECYDCIQYYFSKFLYNKITSFFSDTSIIYYLKKEIICLFSCYDISFNNTLYNQTGILLKTILNIIYSNYIIILYSIIIKTNSQELQKYLIPLQNEITNNQIEYEGPVLKILENNIQYVNNYYKMVIDNVYKNHNKIKFPNGLNYSELIGNNITKLDIISSFFYEAYKRVNENIYSFQDMQHFFNMYLNRNKISNNIALEKKKELINNSIKNVTINNYKITNNNNQRIKYILPKIKNCYEYSLVLDLDETLISYQKELASVILRPGLKEFLHRMKKIYELILFTSATHDYVDPIVNFIEKDEKYFDYILYRRHLSFDEKGEFFKNLNLLNRNCKKIIIVDDTEKNFKLHKSNGICIKPFFGNNDNNILNMMTQILIKIRLDAEKSGDIRLSLKQAKRDLIYKKIENNYK